MPCATSATVVNCWSAAVRNGGTKAVSCKKQVLVYIRQASRQSCSEMAPKRLVIVGLGVAGTQLAISAVKSREFVVISVEPKEFLEVPFPTVRAVVDPAIGDKSLIAYKDIPGGVGLHIRARAVDVNGNTVALDNGDVVDFDYLVLCTGNTHSGIGVITPAATTLAGRKAELQATADRIQEAQNIVVVGGGPVGIEVCGEILDKYAGKSISLLHSGPMLLDGSNPKLSHQLLLVLKKHNVKVFLSERAKQVEEGEHVLLTTTGKQLPADLVIWAAGGRPNTGLLEKGDLAGCLDKNGRAKVDEYLRLKGHPNIFVLGDINDTPQIKLGFYATEQAALTAKNLLLLAAGKNKLQKWKAFLAPKGALLVTFGKGDGAGFIGGCSCGGSMISMLKGKDLFLPKFRQGLGL